MNSNKRIFKNTMYLYFRMLILIVVNLYTSRLVLQLLGVEDYGIYQIVGGIVAIFSIINGALSAGSARFITIALGKGDKDNLKKVFNISFECHLILSFLIFILAESIGLWYINSYLEVPIERMNAVNWIYQFSIISCILSITQVPYSADIIAHERINIYAYIGIVEGIFKLILTMSLFLLNEWDKLIFYGASICGWSIIIQLYYRWYCYKNFPESHLSFIIDKRLFKQMLSFSFWDVIGTFTINGNKQGVNLVINKFFGVIYNASFGLVSSIDNVINQFINNFMTAVNPQITKDYARGEIDKMKNLVYNSSKFGFILYIIIGIPTFIETDYLLELWLVQVPDKASIFLKLTIISAMIRTFARPVIISVHASGNIKQLNLYSGGTSICMIIPMTIISYKFALPIESTYYVMILTYIVCNYIELWCLHKEIDIFNISEYTKKIYLPCVAIAIIAFVADYSIYYHMNSSLIRFIVIAIVNAIVISLSLWITLTKSQKYAIKIKINQRIMKIFCL